MDAAAPLDDARAASDAASHDASADTRDGSTLDGGPTCSTGSLSIATVSDSFLSPVQPLTLSLRSDGASLGWLGFDNGRGRAFVNWFGLGEATFELPAQSDDVDETELAVVATASGFLSVSSYTPASPRPVPAAPEGDAGEGDAAVDGATPDAGSAPADAGVPDAGDSGPRTAQLRLRRTNAVGELVGTAPTSLTSDTSDHHAATLALGADGNVLLVWTALSPSAHGKSLLLAADGTVIGSAHDIPGFGATLGRAALSSMGNGYLLAWVDATMRRVHVQVLDAAGVAVGGNTQVDADGHARGNLDLAFTDQGGALVFDVLVDGVRPEVRARTFSSSGVVTGNERLLTPYPDTGTRPSLVAVRGGYMLAYRSAEAKTQQLRLALLDARAELLRAAPVAPLQAFDLPLVMRISPDGEAVFLSWLDQLPDHNGNQLQRTWIHCD